MLGLDSDRVWVWYIFRRWVSARIIIIIIICFYFPLLLVFSNSEIVILSLILSRNAQWVRAHPTPGKIEFFADDLLQPPSPTERTEESLPTPSSTERHEPVKRPQLTSFSNIHNRGCSSECCWQYVLSNFKKPMPKKPFFLILAL